MIRAPLSWYAAIAFGLTIPAWAAPPGLLPPAADQQLARAIVKELTEIKTTHDHRSTDAAQAIPQRVLAAGFPAGEVVLIAPPEHPTNGNVILRYCRKGSGKAVLFLGHLDVVEVKPKGRPVDRFKLTDQDGWFYGRGTIDMKDGARAPAETPTPCH